MLWYRSFCFCCFWFWYRVYEQSTPPPCPSLPSLPFPLSPWTIYLAAPSTLFFLCSTLSCQRARTPAYAAPLPFPPSFFILTSRMHGTDPSLSTMQPFIYPLPSIVCALLALVVPVERFSFLTLGRWTKTAIPAVPCRLGKNVLLRVLWVPVSLSLARVRSSGSHTFQGEKLKERCWRMRGERVRVVPETHGWDWYVFALKEKNVSENSKALFTALFSDLHFPLARSALSPFLFLCLSPVHLSRRSCLWPCPCHLALPWFFPIPFVVQRGGVFLVCLE